jgi:hypothetical protein
VVTSVSLKCTACLEAVCPFEMFVTFHQTTSTSQKTPVLISELWIIVFQIISLYHSSQLQKISRIIDYFHGAAVDSALGPYTVQM